MKRLGPALALLLILLLSRLDGPVALAQGAPDAQLIARAVLPADTFAPGPSSGARINPAEANGRVVPFSGQPVQGVSAILPEGNGVYLILPDNGFGAKANSDDFLLRVYRVRPTFGTLSTAANVPGRAGPAGVQILGFLQLHDPDRRISWPLVNGATPERFLTGADFDVESVRRAPDGTLWLGDEFGPYLLHADATGRLLDAPYPLPVPEVVRSAGRGLPFVQSPDWPSFVALADADARNDASNLLGSKGFEGMALSADGTRLYPLLEGPLRDDPERRRLLIPEFDLRARRYTGRTFAYRLEDPGHAIRDFTAVNDDEYLVIERDNEQGAGARFKKVFLINLAESDAGGYARKRELVDLLNIADPAGVSGPATAGVVGLGARFAMPFVTIESVLVQDPATLLIVNDNNYPFSTGRRQGTPDDTEFVLLRLSERLNVTARSAGPAGPGGLPRTGARAPVPFSAAPVLPSALSVGAALLVLALMLSYLVERLRRA
jgi:glycerophosphoryl diester phosphodiesterase